jgi:predicted transcriptional regulator
MGDATFTFRVDDALKSAFNEAAKAEDQSAAQLLRGYMRDVVARRREAAEHNHWFRAEIERAMRQADDPASERVPNATVEADWQRQRAELLKRDGD